jgi:hypothetical protein
MHKSLRLVFFLALVCVVVAGGRIWKARAGSSCRLLIPTGGAYDIIRSSSSSEFHELLDDYFAKRLYHTHDEAIQEGFDAGFVIYGVPIQAHRTFTEEQKNKWLEEYRQRTHHAVDTKLESAFNSFRLNTDVVKEVSKCIVQTEGIGLFAELEPTSDGCTAKFSAVYHPAKDDDLPPKIASPGLTVSGGNCDDWPSAVASYVARSVNCRRNGRDALSVSLSTKNAGSKGATIDGLPELGPEPTLHDEYADTFSKPASTDVTLSHDQFQLWNQNGTDRGDYRFTFYHDFTSPSGGPIQSLEVISTTGVGAHFWLCPNNGVCRQQLFEKISDTQWRIYAIRNSTEPAIQVAVKVHYFEKENACVKNCGANVAHAEWLAEKARTCKSVPIGVTPLSLTGKIERFGTTKFILLICAGLLLIGFLIWKLT